MRQTHMEVCVRVGGGGRGVGGTGKARVGIIAICIGSDQ